MFRKFLTVASLLIQLNLEAQSRTDFDKKIEGLLENSNFPGFAISMVMKDSIIFSKGYGFANKEDKIAFRTDHNQIVASISKTWIGIALMKCIEEGYFKLETDVNEILPFKVFNPKFLDQPILIKHLATHTSSIKYSIPDLHKIVLDEGVSWEHFNSKEKKILEKVIENKKIAIGSYLESYLSTSGDKYSAKHYGKYPPGSTYKYSNTAAALASYLVETVTGLSFDDFCARHIIEPLSMANAGFNTSIPNPNKTVRYYFGKDQKPVPPYSHNFYPTGGLNISNDDINLFLMEIIKGYGGQGKLLAADSYQVLLGNQYDKNDLPKKFPADETNHGIFWVHRDQLIGHTGGGLGTSAFLFFNKNTGIGKVFTTNCELESDKKLVYQFIEIWKAMDEF